MTATLEEVKRYWQEQPLFSLERADVGSEEFFRKLEQVRREEVERFALRFWGFDAFPGKGLLDVGCGPGWMTVNYALGGSQVHAVDLTPRAVELTRQYAAARGVEAEVREANVESLPFADGTFDVVVASGVLHHTPHVLQGIRECCRVLRAGGCAKISLYRKGILLRPRFFNLTQALLRVISVHRPGSDLGRAKDVDDFIRQYDGAGNPLGIGKTTQAWRALLLEAGFTVRGAEVHYFPKRFLPVGHLIPRPVHWMLDRFMGAMVYFDLTKG